MSKLRFFQYVRENFRSLPSTQRCQLRFHNFTERVVLIAWVAFNGEVASYKKLERRQFVDINTYKDHPWVCVDYHTKDCLLIDGKEVYLPETTIEFFQRCYKDQILPPNFARARLSVYITLPLYSLRQNCLQVVQNLLGSVENLNSLELPNSVLDDLRILFADRDPSMLIQ